MKIISDIKIKWNKIIIDKFENKINKKNKKIKKEPNSIHELNEIKCWWIKLKNKTNFLKNKSKTNNN